MRIGAMLALAGAALAAWALISLASGGDGDVEAPALLIGAPAFVAGIVVRLAGRAALRAAAVSGMPGARRPGIAAPNRDRGAHRHRDDSAATDTASPVSGPVWMFGGDDERRTGSGGGHSGGMSHESSHAGSSGGDASGTGGDGGGGGGSID